MQQSSYVFCFNFVIILISPRSLQGTDESTLYDFEDELETEKSPRQLSDTSNTSAAQGQKRVRALSPGSNEDGEGRTGAKKRRGFVLV